MSAYVDQLPISLYESGLALCFLWETMKKIAMWELIVEQTFEDFRVGLAEKEGIGVSIVAFL